MNKKLVWTKPELKRIDTEICSKRSMSDCLSGSGNLICTHGPAATGQRGIGTANGPNCQAGNAGGACGDGGFA